VSPPRLPNIEHEGVVAGMADEDIGLSTAVE
jgi:hypothetical protein